MKKLVWILEVAYIRGILRPFPYRRHNSRFFPHTRMPTPPRVPSHSRFRQRGQVGVDGEPMIAFLLRHVQKRIS